MHKPWLLRHRQLARFASGHPAQQRHELTAVAHAEREGIGAAGDTWTDEQIADRLDMPLDIVAAARQQPIVAGDDEYDAAVAFRSLYDYNQMMRLRT